MSSEHRKRPVMLCIMDGWGIAEPGPHNAVSEAETPHFDRMLQQYPHCRLQASEEAVGLPTGQPGNSEVGHMTIGSGRVIMQDLPRIHQAVSSGELSQHPGLHRFASTLKQTGKAAHLTGLTSSGGVHAHSSHILALSRILCDAGVTLYLHLITDGRDCLPQAGLEEISEFAALLPEQAVIASLTGRYFAMDRDNRWDRTQQFVDVVSAGKAPEHAQTAQIAIEQAYSRSETDEFISPTRIGSYQGMAEGDGLVMANFRVDRARQFMRAFYQPAMTECTISHLSMTPHYQGPALSMTDIADDLTDHVESLFPPPDLSGGLGETVAQAGLSQYRIAETEKYPHVTFFFNGGVETPHQAEARFMAASPQVATYDLAPDMSAEQLCAEAVRAIDAKEHDLLILNFANPDMVGHTGSVAAAIQAVETVDMAIGRLEEAICAAGGIMLITADHGNCEVMWDSIAGSVHTAHTTNQVPCILVNGDTDTQLKDGGLADLAPTLLEFLGIPQPDVMTGRSLCIKL